MIYWYVFHKIYIVYYYINFYYYIYFILFDHHSKTNYDDIIEGHCSWFCPYYVCLVSVRFNHVMCYRSITSSNLYLCMCMNIFTIMKLYIHICDHIYVYTIKTRFSLLLLIQHGKEDGWKDTVSKTSFISLQEWYILQLLLMSFFCFSELLINKIVFFRYFRTSDS